VSAPTAILVNEVYSAIQGEGPLVGTRQLFVRLQGCNLRCCYCDQPEALELGPGSALVEEHPGARDFVALPSPMSVEEVAERVAALLALLPHRAVSLTGGEPLAQAPALAALARRLSASNSAPLWLETNGTRPAALAEVLPYLRWVSMDWKLPSTDGERDQRHRARRFLAEAARWPGVEVIVKVVVGGLTTADEVRSAFQAVAAEAPGSVVVVQPLEPVASPIGTWPVVPPEPGQLLALQAEGLTMGLDVRVIPQTHKQMGQR
jgi:7-carboxy-7-deazaguanine synthase